MTTTVLLPAIHYLRVLGVLCIIMTVTSACGVTGDLYLPDQPAPQDMPASGPDSSSPENSSETLPDTNK